MANQLPPRLHKKHGAFYYTPFIDGRVKWIRLSDRLDEALRLWAELETEKKPARTIGDAIDFYLVNELPSKADTTAKEYRRQSVKLRDVFGAMPLDELTKPQINTYIRKRGGHIANREISFLSSIYECAVAEGFCLSNPCRGSGIRRNPEPARKYVPSHAEINQIRDLADDQMKAIIDLVLLTALRESDVLRLRMSAFGPDGLTVSISKTKDVVTYRMTDELNALHGRIKGLRRRVGSVFLFCNRQGQPYTLTGFTSIWRRLKIKAGQKQVRFHDLRARALTDARAARGRDYAQDLAGHADGSMTETYVRERSVRTVEPLK